MADPEQLTGPGDSTPNFDWLRDHDPPAGEPWRAPGGQDSALDMLPPEEQPAAAGIGSGPQQAESLPFLAPGADTGAAPPSETGSAPAAPASAAVSDLSLPTSESGPSAALTGAPAPSSGVVGELPPEVRPTAAAAPLREPPAATDRRNLLLIGLISYASAATLALIYLFLALNNPRPHQLESLPDVPPLQVSKGELMRLVEVSADMPPGHTLRLGESQRYGNIRVEPLRVTREPIAFAHFSGQAGVSKPATAPVLKLWVRFTNVSNGQTIAPLDAGLLYLRTLRDSGEVQANQFVCRASEKTDGGTQVLVYDHPPTSEWDLIGQQLGRPLAPGESLEMYIPTEEEGLDRLTGELVWRVHFRKGYSPSGNGVTTVIEVAFDSSQIQKPAG